MARYTIDGIEYPSVTQILDVLDKPALIPWAANMTVAYIRQCMCDPDQFGDIDDILERAKKEWRNASQDAMDIGTEIHDLIERYIKDGKDAVGDLRPEVENGFLAFLTWEAENIDTWIESELTVCDQKIGFAGRLDAVARMKDWKVYVIDFKSSKGFYDGYDMQTAAYRSAYGKPVDGNAVLRLDKETGLPEWKDYSKTYCDKYRAFVSLVDYYYAIKKRRLKNNPRVV